MRGGGGYKKTEDMTLLEKKQAKQCKWIDCDFDGREDDLLSTDPTVNKEMWLDLKLCSSKINTASNDPYKKAGSKFSESCVKQKSRKKDATSNAVNPFGSALFSNGKFTSQAMPERVQEHLYKKLITSGESIACLSPGYEQNEVATVKVGCNSNEQYGTLTCLAPQRLDKKEIMLTYDHDGSHSGCPYLPPNKTCDPLSKDPDQKGNNCKLLAKAKENLTPFDVNPLFGGSATAHVAECKGPLNAVTTTAKMTADIIQDAVSGGVKKGAQTALDLLA